MLLHCPLCRAANEQGPQCRRCRADLSLLFALEDQRQAHLNAAASALVQQRLDGGAQHAEQTDAIRHGADAARLQAMSALLQRDFAVAWNQYRRARRLAGE